MTDLLTFDRRTAFRAGAIGGLAVLAGGTATACAAAPVAARAAAAVLTSSWFSHMSAALAAGMITLGADNALDAAWAAWQGGFDKAKRDESDRGHKYYSTAYCADGVPPALLFLTSVGEEWDATSDRMIALVNGGTEHVAFDPWAWKALYFFVNDLTGGKDGDTLAGYQALCRISLLPNATVSMSAATDSGRSELLAYKTRNGEVEMNRRTNGDGTTTVQVVATGIPSAADSATTREFDIPDGYSG